MGLNMQDEMQFYYLNPARAPSTPQLYTLIIQSYSYTPNKTASCQNQNTAPDEPLPSPSSSESSAGKKGRKYLRAG